MTTGTEDFTQDEFARVVGEGLRLRAAEDLRDSAPGPRLQERVTQFRRRRQAALASLGVVALLGTAAVANDPALPGKLAAEAAATFGLRLDQPQADGPAGKVGRDATWCRALEAELRRERLEFATGTGDQQLIQRAETERYRVVWADDVAGKRRAIVSRTAVEGEGDLLLAEGPTGTSPRQMGYASATGVGDVDLSSWVFGDGPGRTVLALAPRADSVAFSPPTLGPDGLFDPTWRDLSPLGNGVWAADDVPADHLLVRARVSDAWLERVAGPATDDSLMQSENSASTSGSAADQAAEFQSQDAARLLGAGWEGTGFTVSRPDASRQVVTRAEQDRAGGAWVVTAYAWSPEPSTLEKYATFKVDGTEWALQAYSDVVTAPKGERGRLMVALRLIGNDTQETPIAVLAPDDARTVEANGASYPVRSRVALVPDGGWDFDPQFVAKDAAGAVVGRTRLAVPSSIAGFAVPR